MIRITVLGMGNIGHALVALLGARPEFQVAIWGRRLDQVSTLGVTAFGEDGIYAVGTARTEPSLVKAVDGADVVVCAVPAHIRHGLLRRIRRRLDSCVLLLAWEGMGRFADSVRELGIRPQIAAGLQRSPLVCRRHEPYHSVEILGVRSRVIAAPVDPRSFHQIQKVAGAILPFRFAFVREYAYVALSPGNPLIHPARIYSCAVRRTIAPNSHFYRDWDDDASEVLLGLHRELAELRDVLGLSTSWLSTLGDRAIALSAGQVTREIQAAKPLRSILLPVRATPHGLELDRSHRFFCEDIGEGLMHIRNVSRQCGGPHLPMTEEICRWYTSTAPSVEPCEMPKDGQTGSLT